MGRFFVFDLKRIFGSGRTVALCMAVPFVVMLLFASVVAPLLVTRSRVEETCFAVYNEDGTEITQQFIDFVANSKSFEGIVSIIGVGSLAEGLALVEKNECSGLMYIPAGFYEALDEGKDLTVDIYGSRTNVLECSLVLVAVQTALQTAGGAQNGLRAFERDAAALSGDPGGAAALYEAMLSCGIGAITNRQAILGQDGFISPAGGYLPSEFYLSAMLTWFLALAVLPLAGFSSGDFSLSVLQRGMKTGAMRRHFLTARLFSGAVFLLAVMLLIFPVGLVSASLDRLFAGSVPALFGSMLFLSLCFSALALGISAWMPNRDAAMWIGFWLILALGMAGGAIVPESMLPGWVVRLGAWSPLRAAMRLLASGIFRFDAASFGIDMLKTGLWGLLGAVLAVAGFSRKAAH